MARPKTMEVMMKEFCELKAQADAAKTRFEESKQELSDAIKAQGQLDYKNNVLMEAGPYIGKLERRTTIAVNDETAVALCKEKGLTDCLTQVINKEAFEAAIVDEKLSSAEVSKVVTEKVSFALKVVRKEK